MTHWIIQSSGLRRNDAMIRDLLGQLDAAGVGWTDFGMTPFTNEITNWENFPDEPLFLHGSVKALKVITSLEVPATEIFVGSKLSEAAKVLKNIMSRTFYDEERLSMMCYLRSPIGEHLLNSRAEVAVLDSVLDEVYAEPMFIKPSKDLKLFVGTILAPGVTLRQEFSRTHVDDSFSESMGEWVVVAPYVHGIIGEWRFFVVKGKVVAQSRYQKHKRLHIDKDVPNAVREAAEYFVTLYQPAECFVIDLCMTTEYSIKIVEYNAINCSGPYAADVGAISKALNQLE